MINTAQKRATCLTVENVYPAFIHDLRVLLRVCTRVFICAILEDVVIITNELAGSIFSNDIEQSRVLI